MRRKGQAAMEFLMTYGWAILVVLVAIGALAFFGVLNPARFLPSSCTITPGIGCDDFVVLNTAGGDSVQLFLRNGLGADLTAVTVAMVGCTASLEANGDDAGTDGAVLGGADGIPLTACGTGSVGARFKEDVTVTYTTGAGATHTRTGLITSSVE